jgi:acid phosphatase family membrane protein YuiD
VASETLNFNILARDNASRTFDKVGRSASNAESTFHKVGRGMLAVGKAAAIGLAGGAVLGGLALRKMNEEARESERVTRLTEAIIKSTGGAAKISARQVGELATSISNKTGIDDEAIQTGSNLLLTFKNVRNEVGRGADVFNQATAAAVDLSAAGFGSIDSASKMLGKALNDPIAGLTALGRAGVTFTEAQKEQIKGMVESGNLLKAQKVIMAEVQSQVGGAAAATATGMDKLKVTVANLAEEVGLKLLPYIDKAAGWLGDRLPGALDAARTKLGEISDFVSANVVPRIQSLVRWVRDELIPALQNFANAVAPAVRDALGSISGALDRLSNSFDTGQSKSRTYGNTLTAVFNNVGPFVSAMLKQMAANVEVLSRAFEIGTFVIRKMAGLIASHISDMVATAIGALVGLARAAANTADALGMDGLAEKLRGAADKMENFKWKVQAQLSGMGDMGRAAGSALGQGLAAGIAASGEVAIATARNTVNRINAMMRSTGEIRSPSKVTTRIGEQLAEGLAVGLDRGSRSAVDASASLMVQAMAPIAPAGRVAPQAPAGNTYNIYDATDPEAVVRAIQQYERRNGSGWRS